MYTPPGVPRSRSLTRLTMRVGLLHLGQSVLLLVSITFLRSAVLAILAMEILSPGEISSQCLACAADFYLSTEAGEHQQSSATEHFPPHERRPGDPGSRSANFD